jgi:2-polyprenyl-3-methyl-5-hydroxy-6-metoxy-1,4-benzoquinol methylase
MPWTFGVRRREPEIMDQPGIARQPHIQALRGLARLNRFSRSAAILWPSLRDLARRVTPRPLRVLDLATGGGDIPIQLFHRACRESLPVVLEACDRSEQALEHAREQARRYRADVRFFAWDALAGPLPCSYDAVVSSLFLHHLGEDEAVVVLRHMAGAARQMVLVNDLRRGRLGWLLAWLGTRLLTRSPVVHTDGPLSVAAAFTCDEARELAARAGLDGATVVPRWPFRFLLSWQRPPHIAPGLPGEAFVDAAVSPGKPGAI